MAKMKIKHVLETDNHRKTLNVPRWSEQHWENILTHLSRICGTVINLTSSKDYKWSTAVGLYKRTNEKVGSRWSQRRSALSAFETKGLTHILIVSWTEKRTNKINSETSNLSQGITGQSILLRCDLSRSAKNFFRNSWIWTCSGLAPKPNGLFLIRHAQRYKWFHNIS